MSERPFPFSAKEVKEYREKHEVGLMEAKRMMLEEHRDSQRRVLDVLIKHAEINKDLSMIIGALKILAERY